MLFGLSTSLSRLRFLLSVLCLVGVAVLALQVQEKNRAALFPRMGVRGNEKKRMSLQIELDWMSGPITIEVPYEPAALVLIKSGDVLDALGLALGLAGLPSELSAFVESVTKNPEYGYQSLPLERRTDLRAENRYIVLPEPATEKAGGIHAHLAVKSEEEWTFCAQLTVPEDNSSVTVWRRGFSARGLATKMWVKIDGPKPSQERGFTRMNDVDDRSWKYLDWWPAGGPYEQLKCSDWREQDSWPGGGRIEVYLKGGAVNKEKYLVSIEYLGERRVLETDCTPIKGSDEV